MKNQTKENIIKSCEYANVKYYEGDIVEICSLIENEKKARGGRDKEPFYPIAINFFTSKISHDSLYENSNVKILFVMDTELHYTNKQRTVITFPILYEKIDDFLDCMEFNSIFDKDEVKTTELQKINGGLQNADKKGITFDNLDGILLEFIYKTVVSDCNE